MATGGYDLFKSIAVVFLVAGILITVISYINEEFNDTLYTGVLLNESASLSNASTYVTHTRGKRVAQIANYTHMFPSQLGSGNSVEANWTYTKSGLDLLEVTIYTNETYTDGTYNVSYYANTEAGYDASRNMSDAIDTYASWQSMIALILAVGFILGITWIANRRESMSI